MQGDINPSSGGLSVIGIGIQERIKRRGWIRIQQRVPQPGLADLAYGQVLPLVPRVTEARFPVPSLEIIAKFSHLTLQPDVEKSIPVSELLASGAGVVNATKPNPRSHGDWDSVNIQSRIRDRERIKRIRDWDTDTDRTKDCTVRVMERVGPKRHSCQGRIEKRADIFKVGKHRQIFVANVACERTVEALFVRRR